MLWGKEGYVSALKIMTDTLSKCLWDGGKVGKYMEYRGFEKRLSKGWGARFISKGNKSGII